MDFSLLSLQWAPWLGADVLITKAMNPMEERAEPFDWTPPERDSYELRDPYFNVLEQWDPPDGRFAPPFCLDENRLYFPKVDALAVLDLESGIFGYPDLANVFEEGYGLLIREGRYTRNCKMFAQKRADGSDQYAPRDHALVDVRTGEVESTFSLGIGTRKILFDRGNRLLRQENEGTFPTYAQGPSGGPRTASVSWIP